MKNVIKERKEQEKLILREITELSLANMEEFKMINKTNAQAVCNHIIKNTKKHHELSIKLYDCRKPVWTYNF